MKLFSALKHRGFALLVRPGDFAPGRQPVPRVALAWWVLEKTGSAAARQARCSYSRWHQPLMLCCSAASQSIRFPRIRLMLAPDLLRGLVMAIVAALAFANMLQVWHVYVASVVFGFVDAFFNRPTCRCPRSRRARRSTSANALTSLSRQLTGTVGPAIGATIVALGGYAHRIRARRGLVLHLGGVRTAHPPQAPPRAGAHAEHNILHDLREGLAAAGTPWLWVTITLAALGNVTAGGPLAVALPFLIKNTLKADVGLLGLPVR
ncbi:MAG: hypothetical protein U0Z44_02885 [Kouleothrix sp.]